MGVASLVTSFRLFGSERRFPLENKSALLPGRFNCSPAMHLYCMSYYANRTVIESRLVCVFHS